MESANFIPLGSSTERASIGKVTNISDRPKEDRKQIARRIRLAAKKEKKKAKSDAKKARKLNAILTRRMVKSPQLHRSLVTATMLTEYLDRPKNREKYSKNKDRNRLQGIEFERHKIRTEAVRQAERLAAIHDPSGEKFNVGPVRVLENGTVKSVAYLAQRSQAIAAEESTTVGVDEGAVRGVNPDRQALIQNGQEEPPKVRKLSRKQQKKQAMLQPRPVPPKPIIPDGVSLPEGEEDWLSLWDITDENILKRLALGKRKKVAEAKALRRKQKEEAKIRKAMKLKRKQADRLGIPWDADKARKELLHGAQSESGSESDSDAGSGDKEPKEPAENADADTKKSTESVEQPFEEDIMGKTTEPVAKTEVAAILITEDPVEKKKKRKHKSEGVKPITENEVDEKAARKERRRSKREEKRQEELGKLGTETNEDAAIEVDSKKRKRSRHDNEETEAVPRGEKDKQKKSHKKKRAKVEEEKSNTQVEVAGQWNPDALTGDAARKDKFLRLLGAGKANGAKDDTVLKMRSSRNAVEISHVESELERQYEAGMKLKHEGQGKKRGLGA